jgi:NAD(P)-dependent dehydrogenase (short-subunit alcohol dehydrogenase family)
MPTILITGAGRGLGLELARQYAADGWKVIGTERGAQARYRMDVRDISSIRRLSQSLKGEPIDVLFCNAGIIGTRGSALGSFDYAAWEEIFRVNVLGAAATVEALVDNVAASGRKIIAVMSSRLGSVTETSGATLPYGTSKAALNLLAKGLAMALQPRGITVVAFTPGWVRTDMGGAGAPLSPEESVAGLRNVIAALDLSHSGKFMSHDGKPVPW